MHVVLSSLVWGLAVSLKLASFAKGLSSARVVYSNLYLPWKNIVKQQARTMLNIHLLN